MLHGATLGGAGAATVMLLSDALSIVALGGL